MGRLWYQFLLIAGLAHAHPLNFTESSTLISRDYVYENFKYIDCEMEEEAMIETSFSNVHEMLKIQRDSLIDAQNYLQGVLNNQNPRMTPEQQNKMEAFMMFYGNFDYTDDCEIADNMGRTEQVADAVRRIDQIMADFAFSGKYAPSIFCNDEFFEYDRTVGTRNYYRNVQDAQQRQIIVHFGDKTGVCGDGGTSAAMLYPLTGKDEDWMLICPFMFDEWRGDISEEDADSQSSDLNLNPRHLSDYRALPLEKLLGMKIDDIMRSTPEALTLHELSHSLLIFHLLDVDHNGNQRDFRIMLDDVEVAPGQDAYDFHGVTALAQVARNDPVKMVRNADTLAYHAGAVYLSQCNWAPDGVCKAPQI